MNTSIGSIALLYEREKTLRALVIFFFGCVAITWIPGALAAMYSHLPWMHAFQSVIIMLALWMAFLIGIIVKRQFADYRASLLPGYRRAHALVFVLILATLVLTGILWTVYLAKVFHAGFDILLSVVAASVFVAVVIIVLGYLSAAWLVVLSFIVFCLFSDPAYLTVAGVLGDTTANILALVIAAVICVLFLKRIMELREESPEYPYIFSWSGRLGATEHNANWVAANCALAFLRKLFGFKADIDVTTTYFSARGLFARAMHRECLKWENYKLAVIVLAVLTPFYIFYIHLVPRHFASIINGHLKYFLLGVYPVVLSVGLNQKSIRHWGYELTLPVNRWAFIREKGTGILLEICFYWLLALIFVMVIPNAILEGARLLTVRFWAEMFLTLTFVLTAFGWISSLHGATSGRTVLALLGLGALSSYQFYMLPSAELAGVVSGIVIWLLVGVVLCRIACRKWMNAEFN